MRRRAAKQHGNVLLLCMTLLMLLGLLGLSAMQGAIQQQRMASHLLASMRAFESAERLLRVGEARLPGAVIGSCGVCLPPPEAEWVQAAGIHHGGGGSGLVWQRGDAGLYLIQNLGPSNRARGMPEELSVTLFRITAIGLEGESRVVLESTFAWPELRGDVPARRIAWRQIF